MRGATARSAEAGNVYSPQIGPATAAPTKAFNISSTLYVDALDAHPMNDAPRACAFEIYRAVIDGKSMYPNRFGRLRQ